MSQKLPQSPDGSRSAEEARRRRILTDPPPEPELSAGERRKYLAGHGVALTATALIRRGDRFIVLPETSL